MGRAIVSLTRIREILSTEQEVMAGELNLSENQQLRGQIEFQNVSFSYGDSQPVLRDISLQILPGETIAILGATGAGKSSLAHLLPRLFELSQGTILIDGIDILRFDRQQLRKQIGIVLQEPFLYSRTLAENIGIALPKMESTPTVNSNLSVRQRIEQVSREVALHDTIIDFENGYDTIVGEKGITLSGGQRQRTAMARALITEPSILILDDSLSAVDSETEHEIQKNLLLRKGKSTTIIITHRLTSVAIADRILVLEHGRIAQLGTHAQLISQEGLYQRIWGIQNALEDEAS
jgi:ATP-binding cassette subfamily B protein